MAMVSEVLESKPDWEEMAAWSALERGRQALRTCKDRKNKKNLVFRLFLLSEAVNMLQLSLRAAKESKTL